MVIFALVALTQLKNSFEKQKWSTVYWTDNMDNGKSNTVQIAKVITFTMQIKI